MPNYVDILEVGLPNEKIDNKSNGNFIYALFDDEEENSMNVLPFSYDSIGQGTFVCYNDPLQFCNGLLYNSTSTDNDNISYIVNLKKGTYNLKLFGKSINVGANIDIWLDSNKIATFDMYSAATVYNKIYSKNGIIVNNDSIKTLKLQVNGKNGASLGYMLIITYLNLTKVANL